VQHLSSYCTTITQAYNGKISQKKNHRRKSTEGNRHDWTQDNVRVQQGRKTKYA